MLQLYVINTRFTTSGTSMPVSSISTEMAMCGALHLGQVFRTKHVIDLWWRVKGRVFIPGRGYEEWVWQSVREYLRVSGEGGRAWRVMID